MKAILLDLSYLLRIQGQVLSMILSHRHAGSQCTAAYCNWTLWKVQALFTSTLPLRVRYQGYQGYQYMGKQPIQITTENGVPVSLGFTTTVTVTLKSK